MSHLYVYLYECFWPELQLVLVAQLVGLVCRQEEWCSTKNRDPNQTNHMREQDCCKQDHRQSYVLAANSQQLLMPTK